MEEFIEPINGQEVAGKDAREETLEADAEMLAVAAQNAGIIENESNDTCKNQQGESSSAEIETELEAENCTEETSIENEVTADDTQKEEPGKKQQGENSFYEEASNEEGTDDVKKPEDDFAAEIKSAAKTVAGKTTNEDANAAKEEIIIKSVTSSEGVEVTVESVVEAVLFACDEPVTPNKLVNILGTGSVRQIRECIMELNKKYEGKNSAFRIEKIAGGYQMMTLDAYNHWLRKLIKVRADSKLTQAALETLAIVAYKQPIIRADVEAIRGVSSGEMIRSLMYKGLVKIAGRAEMLGRPMLYGTTKKFLDVFGLNTTKDLPKVEELKKSN